MPDQDLQHDYIDHASDAERLSQVLLQQFDRLLIENDIAIGVPIESRVKQWSSIEEKIERKALTLTTVSDLDDLVGARIILLFSRDLDRVEKVIGDTFEVLSSEDTGTRLAETQFGYHSRHYIIRIPETWRDVPVFRRLRRFKAEVQVRTLAQHIWAAASHKLQYKQEDSVPPPVRRTIHRVSALLETVDLEFERVLATRDSYIQNDMQEATKDEPLNVDLIASILNDTFPAENRGEAEDYNKLLTELLVVGLGTVGKFRQLLAKHMPAVLKEERERVTSEMTGETKTPAALERASRGVFFKHVGLARIALMHEFGRHEYVKKVAHLQPKKVTRKRPTK